MKPLHVYKFVDPDGFKHVECCLCSETLRHGDLTVSKHHVAYGEYDAFRTIYHAKCFNAMNQRKS